MEKKKYALKKNRQPETMRTMVSFKLSPNTQAVLANFVKNMQETVYFNLSKTAVIEAAFMHLISLPQEEMINIFKKYGSDRLQEKY